jgi:ubiquinone/menaquinone biosynthesis C-methylase UbiE
MMNRFSKHIPAFVKKALKKVYFFGLDIIDSIKGGRDSMIPPRSIVFIGGGDFIQIGQEFKKYFIDLANLQPDNRVLDVGCGIGRMAIPLTGYLSSKGEYWGFDIVAKGIKWCQSRISSRYGNFHFLHCDIYNKYYNRKGKILAKDYQFPFDNEFFDFIFLTSVFTHMLPSDLENYLREISRVLKVGGKCLITFFLLNDEAENFIRSGLSSLDFHHKMNDCSTIDENKPETAIAYQEGFVRRLFDQYGLTIIEPIHFGSWCKRDTFLTYQDIIVATKNNSNSAPVS